MKRIELDRKEKEKEAKHASGCFSGTSAHIVDAFMSARNDSYKPPKFRPWENEGCVGIQISNGKNLTVEDALACTDNRIKIELLEDMPLKGKAKRERYGQPRTAAVATVQIANGRQIRVPFVMHRPLPEGSEITWVKLYARRIGLRTVYELQFTLNLPKAQAKKPTKKKKAAVLAINFGWRKLPNGNLRVAVTWDGQKSVPIDLPGKIEAQSRMTEDLLGYCDTHFNEAIDCLRAWKKRKKKKLPEAVEEALENFSSWKRHGRLARATQVLLDTYAKEYDVMSFWDAWKEERFATKADLFDTFQVISNWLEEQGVEEDDARVAMYLSWWRRKDRHLINYARGNQTRLRIYRREIYRRWAYQWAQEYDTVVFEEWNKSKTARTPYPENDTRTKQEIQGNSLRQLCGISVFTEALKLRFGKRAVEDDAHNTTLIHHGCGGSGVTALPNKLVECTKCGSVYDQDVNTARHLYDRFCEGSSGSKKARTSRKAKSRTKAKEAPTATMKKGPRRPAKKQPLASQAVSP